MKPERRDGQASDPEQHLHAGGDESDGDGAIAVMAAAPFDANALHIAARQARGVG